MLVHPSARGILDVQGDPRRRGGHLDRGASAKDEMGHRADACFRRPDRLLFDPLMLDGIKGDLVCFRMLEPMVCGDSGKHIGISDALCTKEVSFGICLAVP